MNIVLNQEVTKGTNENWKNWHTSVSICIFFLFFSFVVPGDILLIIEGCSMLV